MAAYRLQWRDRLKKVRSVGAMCDIRSFAKIYRGALHEALLFKREKPVVKAHAIRPPIWNINIATWDSVVPVTV